MPDIDKLASGLRRGLVSRRQFMEGAIALGVSVIAAEGIMKSAHAATPKKGGTFRVGLGGASTTDLMDPATFISTFTQIGNSFGLYNQLTEVAPDGSLVPELAESYEATKDAKTWTFKLRKGVTFHDGKPLTADDVVASVQHHRGADSKSALKPLLEPIEEIKIDGDAIVFKLKEGNADFPFLMNDYHLPICPSKEGKIDFASGNGTGPYKFVSLDPGVKMVLDRNPNYWKEGRAHFDKCVMLGIPDATARQNALVSGEVDAINHVDLKTANLLGQTPGIKLEEHTGTQHFTLPMNCTVAPFDNADVRLALKYAIDRDALVKAILFGHGLPANDHPIAPANIYYAGDIEQRKFDPDKAKFHLKKAGLDKLKVDLSAADTAFAGATDTATLYSEQASKCGIEINVIREPNDGYWTNVWMKKPWSASYWGGRPTEDWMFTIGYAKGGAWNESFWSNDTFMGLLTTARAELDTTKRREMYREMQMLVRDDGGSVIPMYANWVDARSDKVAHDDKVAANWELDGWKVLERWWFA